MAHSPMKRSFAFPKLHELHRGQLAHSLGTFVPVFPQARGLRPQSSSWGTQLSCAQTNTPLPPLLEDIGISSRVSPVLLSTSLHMPQQASRVHIDGLKHED